MLLPFDRRASTEEDAQPSVPPVLTFEELPELEEDPERVHKRHRARLRRREKIQRVADAAAREWRRIHGIRPDPTAPPVLRELPRTPGLGVAKGEHKALPPRRREEIFTAGWLTTMSRLLVWLGGAIHFMFGILTDKLLRRDTVERRAIRLRETFEAMGTTFIKLGQQLSMRLDVLPYAYTRELEAMLDKVEPMQDTAAIETIERATGKKLEESFSAFDRNPIGSASVACVYRAMLTTGEHVAVKVRRPGIGPALAADMRALRWLLFAGELLFVPPGFTRNLVHELESMLFEELDFVREARFGDLYRRKMMKTKQFGFATAPKVYFDLSSSEVLVAEFVTGIWIHEVISAVETNDEVALDKLREMNIEPVILARRIQLVARFNNFENIFFHADIHPANMLVQPGNKIVLIDFGSCGSFSKRELNSWRRWFDAQSVNDVSGMVQAALGIIEPVPPIDKDEFALRLESMFWNDLYAIKSKHSDWSERISARLWLGFIKLSQEYRVPMRLNTLRMIRASMLADTIAARLDNDQDPYAEFRHYEKGAGKRAHKRLSKRLRKLAGPSKFIRIENGLEAGLKLVYQVQRTVDSLRSIGVIPLIGKAALAMQWVLRTLATIAAGGGAAAFYLFAREYVIYRADDGDAPHAYHHYLFEVVQTYQFSIFVMIVLAIAGRRVLSRLRDRDNDNNSRR
jgi:predicted unusual protein kinase regulating ubiquinone biosynthesis (AarF/ABC1/UbiB family)